MIPTSLAAVLTLVSLIFISVCGIAAGFLASFALRLPWNFKAAVIDAVVAVAVTIITGFVLVSIDTTRGVLESRLTPLFLIAIFGVVLRHVLRFVLHKSR